MKNVVAVLVLVAFVGSVATLAMGEDKPKEFTFKGTVVKVDGNVVTLTIKTGDVTKDRPFNTDEKTVVTIDGKDAKVADLKAGMLVELTRPIGDNSPATKIVATTPLTPAAGGST